jgi:hypothetical protein
MLQEVEKFLSAIGGVGPFTFLTLDDGALKRKYLTLEIHGDSASQFNRLKNLNEKGAGIFVMVNKGDQKGRKSANVVSVRAVFVDLDGSPIEPVLKGPLAPHIVVETSSDKYHAYWLVDDMPRDSFKSIQQILARKFGGDMKVCDLPRVMRIPGFYHNKGHQFLTRVLEINNHPRYKFNEFIDAFGISKNISNWKSNEPIVEEHRNDSLFARARGFVQQGLDLEGVYERIKEINTYDCKPPLSDDEVLKIVKSAVGYGAQGAVKIDYSIFDSPNYMALTHQAKALDMVARRLSKNNSETEISLTLKDLARFGFRNAKSLAKYREELIDAGYLIVVRLPKFGVGGDIRVCGLFRIAS